MVDFATPITSAASRIERPWSTTSWAASSLYSGLKVGIVLLFIDHLCSYGDNNITSYQVAKFTMPLHLAGKNH
jgi:hypothetical protein